MSVLGPQHISRVRVLYKAILRLHKGLPMELKVIGDQYVKDEFRRHKAAEIQFVGVFLKEWADYAVILAKQLGKRTSRQTLGLPIDENTLDDMSDDQVTQLFELFNETQKPRDPSNPLGYDPSVHDSVKEPS